MTHLTPIADPGYEIPAEEDIAWAERDERQRIASGYWTAFHRRDFTTAWTYRMQAAAYEQANPESSGLLAELVALNYQAA